MNQYLKDFLAYIVVGIVVVASLVVITIVKALVGG